MPRASTRIDSISSRGEAIVTALHFLAPSLLMKRNLSSERYLAPISRDGISDALTFLPAPAYFYQYLYREILIIERSGAPLTLIRLVMTPIRPVDSPATAEIAIVNFAKALNRSIRRSDLASRVGDFEFMLAISDYPQAPDEITGRIFSLWRDEDFAFYYSSTQYYEGEGALSLMQRLDSAHKYRP